MVVELTRECLVWLAIGGILVFAMMAMGIGVLMAMLFLKGRGTGEGGVYQAGSDVVGLDALAGIFPEDGSSAYQAGSPELEDELKKRREAARREYEEAMRIVDMQTERAIRETLVGRRQAAGGQAQTARLLDPDFWKGPHQAPGPGGEE